MPQNPLRVDRRRSPRIPALRRRLVARHQHVVPRLVGAGLAVVDVERLDLGGNYAMNPGIRAAPVGATDELESRA